MKTGTARPDRPGPATSDDRTFRSTAKSPRGRPPQTARPLNIALRQFGTSDLWITPLGIGTAPVGSDPSWRIWWGPQDAATSIRAIHAGLDLGVN
jgi:hypothetical protein